MYRWVVLFHVLAVLTFVLLHGASAVAMLKLRKERDIGRVKALLQLSAYPMMLGYGSFALVIISGIALGFMGGWWARAWIWVALGLVVLIFLGMGGLASTSMNVIRDELGLPSSYGNPHAHPDREVDPARLEERLDRLPAIPVSLIGGIGLALLTWLMMFKPF